MANRITGQVISPFSFVRGETNIELDPIGQNIPKNFLHTAVSGDTSPTFIIGLGPSDSAPATESLAFQSTFGREFTDSTSAVSTPALTPIKIFGDSSQTSFAITLAPNLGPSDSAPATESLLFTVAQALADSAVPIESPAIALSKPAIADSVSAAESFVDVITYNRSFGDSIGQDSAAAIESIALAPSVVFGHSAGTLDSPFNIDLTTILFFSDGQSVIEAINSFVVGKSVADSAAATELLDLDATFNRALGDSIGQDSAAATESAALSIARPLSDSAGTSDSNIVISFTYDEILSDSATASDTSVNVAPTLDKTDIATTSESLIFSTIGLNPSDSSAATETINSIDLTHIVSDSVASSESLIILQGVGLFDVANQSDSGSLAIQNYFESDYVVFNANSMYVADSTAGFT